MNSFWVRVDKTDGCWFWTGGKNSKGYPYFYDGSKTRRAHRVAYELLVGPIPEGATLDHLCRVRHCVNPAHLEPVTGRENTLRGEGFSARNARKTHCPKGHPYDKENTTLRKNGARECLTCERELKRERNRRWRSRKKATAAA